MNNSLLIDTFDFSKAGIENAKHIDVEQFIEGLIFYDKVIFSVNYLTICDVIKQLIDMMGETYYKKLIDKKIIDFVIDDMGYILKDKGHPGNMTIGKYEMLQLKDEDMDIEKNLKKAIPRRTIVRPMMKFLNNSSQKISLTNIKGAAYQGNIANYLSSGERIREIWSVNNPKEDVSNFFEDYKIIIDDGLIKVNTDIESEKCEKLFVILGVQGFGALRAETFKFIAQKADCDNLSGTLMTSNILSDQFIELNKTESKIMNIFELDNIPFIMYSNLSFERILKIRNDTKHIRKLLRNFKEFDQEKFKGEYLNYFERSHLYLDNKYSKVMRFVIPNSIGMVNTFGGIAASGIENTLANILEQKKSAKLRTIFKQNNLL